MNNNIVRLWDETIFSDTNSFIVIRKKSKKYQLNEVYIFTDGLHSHLGHRNLVFIKEFTIPTATSFMSFLHKNVNLDLYRDILKLNNTEQDELLFLVFSSNTNFSYD